MIVPGVFRSLDARQSVLARKIQAVLSIGSKSGRAHDFYRFRCIDGGKVIGRAAQESFARSNPQRPISRFMQGLNITESRILQSKFPERLAVVPEQAVIGTYPNQLISVFQH